MSEESGLSDFINQFHHQNNKSQSHPILNLGDNPHIKNQQVFLNEEQHDILRQQDSQDIKVDEKQNDIREAHNSYQRNRAQVQTEQKVQKQEQDNYSLVGCTCKKSKCQQSYCNCFRAGKLCGIKCICLDCNNKLLNLLKSSKKKKQEQTKGCKCKNSHCLKNYCSCRNSKKQCSKDCSCQDCYNNSEQRDVEDR